MKWPHPGSLSVERIITVEIHVNNGVHSQINGMSHSQCHVDIKHSYKKKLFNVKPLEQGIERSMA
jgi:hypothetical protein